MNHDIYRQHNNAHIPSKRQKTAPTLRRIFVLMVACAILFVCEIVLVPKSMAVDWINGEAFSFGPPTSSNPSFTVDILSVATINRTELLAAQKRTFANHSSVRNFFNATEVDDYDPTCYRDLTWEHVAMVSNFCRHRPVGISREYRAMRGMYARTKFLSQKPNPVGWLCAIQRPYAGLRKAYLHYQRTRQRLPDYFIILDDDTWYNMHTFQRNHEWLNSSELSVKAGCLVRQPVRQVNFTFPFGGYGAVFSKGTLEYLFQPIVCLDGIGGNGSSFPMVANHPNHEAICKQLAKDMFWELHYFQNGMSLLDLIYAYVNTERYRDVANWTYGFCLHSDWVMGYFVNFYNASQHTEWEFYKNVPQARIEAYKDSRGQMSEIYEAPRGLCTSYGGRCRQGVDICHKPGIKWMEREWKYWNTNHPAPAGPKRVRREAIMLSQHKH